MTGKKWFPSAEVLAQLVHFFAALAFVFGAAAIHIGGEWGAVAILALAFMKEFAFDPVVEGRPFLWYGVRDWLVYSLGVTVAFAVLIWLNPWAL